jgi:hypothetical protein
MQLTRVSQQLAVDRQLGAPTGMEWRVLVSGYLDGQSKRTPEGARRLDGIRPQLRPAGAPPAGVLPLSGKHDGHPAGLIR